MPTSRQTLVSAAGALPWILSSAFAEELGLSWWHQPNTRVFENGRGLKFLWDGKWLLACSLHSFAPSTVSGNTELQPQCRAGQSPPSAQLHPSIQLALLAALMAPIELAITPQVRLLGCSPASHPQTVHTTLPQVQIPALAAVEFHTGCDCPAPCKSPLGTPQPLPVQCCWQTYLMYVKFLNLDDL